MNTKKLMVKTQIKCAKSVALETAKTYGRVDSNTSTIRSHRQQYSLATFHVLNNYKLRIISTPLFH